MHNFVCVRHKPIIVTVCLSVKSKWGKSSLLQQGTEERGQTETRSIRALSLNVMMVLSGRGLRDGIITGNPGFLIGGAQITCNDVFKDFRNEAFFTEQWYLKMEDQKQWPGLARNLDFAEGAGLEVNVEKLKCLNWEKMSHLV